MKVYLITFPHGKRYAGVEKNDRQRWFCHKNSSSKTLVDNKIKKYGWINCTFEYVFEGSPEECWQKEKELIKLYSLKNYNNGYNLTDGGENNAGCVWSDSRKKRWSNLMKKKYVMTKEFFIKARVAAKTRPRSKAEYDKKSMSMKSAWMKSEKLKNRKLDYGSIAVKSSATKKERYASGRIVPWNKNKKGLQTAWNKGKKMKYKPRPKMKQAWLTSPRLANRNRVC